MREDIIYLFAKKCERPEGHFWNFMNFFFCQVMVLYGLRSYRQLKKKFPDKQLLLIPSGSAGDFVLYSYYRHYLLRDLNKEEKETVLICAECNRASCQANGLVNAHFLPMSQIAALSMAFHYYGSNQIQITDAYRWCLFDYGNIQNPEVVPIVTKFDGDMSHLVANLEKIGCQKGNTVILSPYEQSITASGEQKPVRDFWLELAQMLKNQGLCVCTNCKGDAKEPPIEGTASIYPALNECEALVDIAGGAVILRSGFADFTAMSKGTTIVLYPSDVFYLKHKLWNDGSFNNHYELIYQGRMKEQTDRKKMIAEIVEKLKNEKNF